MISMSILMARGDRRKKNKQQDIYRETSVIVNQEIHLYKDSIVLLVDNSSSKVVPLMEWRR